MKGLVCFLVMISALPTKAETFDFGGRAIVTCTCPGPVANNTCTSGREPNRYDLTIFVKPGLSIDLNDECYRKRDIVLCCADPPSQFNGTISKKCPGSQPC